MNRSELILKLIEDAASEGFEFKILGVIKDTLYTCINGRKYGYAEMNGGPSMKEIEAKLKYMSKAPGRALAWLKKNSELVSGSVVGVPPEQRAKTPNC